MTNSLISNIKRRRVAVAVASIAAAGALAVPGVAWAQNAIPSGSPAVVEAGAATDKAQDVFKSACQGKTLSDEEFQKMIADGKISIANSTQATGAQVLSDGESQKLIADGEISQGTTLSDEEFQKMIADGKISIANSTQATAATVLSDEEIQKMIADGKISQGENVAKTVASC
ncbi:hypothetical protein [Prescottella agglutinans]|uniref:16S rRNA U516 pseudouridylate synthase RsuA-like enzyme n=1 Tax=Prescottella agglutinans TaxID=1644129 RepID=A0ABT6M6L0_9NOCA|nr:hypothetical protein [Prescottella agglutinans]MDH6279949.1 16S rRNA U516 pseudouridylate synthase RsuA-like enzyme [Prescottella agglutinans]